MQNNIQECKRKLKKNIPLDQEELADLVTNAETLLRALSFMASCEAATLEGLTKSSSKSERKRHVDICKAAAGMLIGDLSGDSYPTNPEVARARCLDAIEKYKA